VLSHGHQEHIATLSSSSAELAQTAGDYLLGAIRRGGTGIVVATQVHRRLIDARLAQAGTDPAAARAAGSYVVLDAASALDRFLINGWPDPAGFWQTFSPVLKRAARRRRQVRVVTELGSMLRESGQPGTAVDVEALWNELARQHRFSLLCAYPGQSGRGQDDDLVLALGEHERITGRIRPGKDAMSA
jgi:hypothetical protein